MALVDVSIDWAFLLSRPPEARGRRMRPPHAPSSNARSVKDSLRGIGGVVWALGLTSLFTDISSEMVASVLPCIWCCTSA